MRAWIAAAAVLALVSPVAAAPKGPKAKAAFDRGVVAYQKGEFAAASEALEASFNLEADLETLFAWAQSERQLERCDKAIELFEKLLGYDMPAENKAVIRSKVDECKEIIAARQPPPEAPPEAPPEVVAPPVEVTPVPEQPRPGPERSPWWKDPIGGAAVGLGVVGLGVGGGFLVSARNAERDASNADSDAVFDNKNHQAESHGRIGLISTIAGGVLIAGGIVRYVTRGGDGGGSEERTRVTGWLSPDGGGVTAIGRF